MAKALCLWCQTQFEPRRGGSPQRFCCAAHRLAFWSALRRWGERAVASGVLTVARIRNAAPEACTLLSAVASPEGVSEDHGLRPASVALLAESPLNFQQDLEERMARAIAVRRRG